MVSKVLRLSDQTKHSSSAGRKVTEVPLHPKAVTPIGIHLRMSPKGWDSMLQVPILWAYFHKFCGECDLKDLSHLHLTQVGQRRTNRYKVWLDQAWGNKCHHIPLCHNFPKAQPTAHMSVVTRPQTPFLQPGSPCTDGRAGFPRVLPLLLPLSLQIILRDSSYICGNKDFPVTFGREIVASDTSKGCRAPPHQCSDILHPRLCITLSSPFIPRASSAAQELHIQIKALSDSKSTYLASLSLRVKFCSDQPQAPCDSSHSTPQPGRVVMGHGVSVAPQIMPVKKHEGVQLSFWSFISKVKATSPQHTYISTRLSYMLKQEVISPNNYKEWRCLFHEHFF